MPEVAIQMPADYMAAVRAALPEDAQLIESRAFAGAASTLTLVVTLTTASIGALCKIICEAIRSRRYIKVHIDGISVDGITEESAMQILSDRLQNRVSTKRIDNGDS